QLVSLRFSDRTPKHLFRYQRTPSHAAQSEATVAAYLRKSIFRMFAQNPHLSITQIIKSKQENAEVERDSLVS
ncbi:transposase, partial [Paenibacillus albidus]|nr:transposase [Paenibacillus albidus]